MKAHILASNDPTALKGTKLPESSKPEPGFLPDPYVYNNWDEALSQPLRRSKAELRDPFLDGEDCNSQKSNAWA